MVRFDMAYKARPVSDRFWEKVDKSTDCWPWTGATQAFGYGKFVVTKGSSPVGAHRLSYEMEVGSIPEGMQVLHRCDNPACVNPAHLFLGTQADNIRDMRAKGRWKYKPRNQSGERNPNAILSDAEVKAMLKDLSDGGRPVSVARKYGIQYRTLWAIRRRKTVSD
jgi:HNH endonuclease